MHNTRASSQDSLPKVVEQETWEHELQALHIHMAGAPATTPMKPTIIAATAAPKKPRASGHASASYQSLHVTPSSLPRITTPMAGTIAACVAWWLQLSKRPTSRALKLQAFIL